MRRLLGIALALGLVLSFSRRRLDFSKAPKPLSHRQLKVKPPLCCQLSFPLPLTN